MKENEAWRTHPVATSARVVLSLMRRRVARWSEPVVAFDGGRSRMIANLRTSTGLALYRYGISDPELDLVRLLLEPGDVFIDAGANIGLFTLVAAAKIGPTGRVLACDPAPGTARMLRRNAEINGFTWIDVRQVALAERSGTEPFFVFEGEGSGLSSFAPLRHEIATSSTATVATLDELIPEAERQRVAFLKVDVEGAELRLIRGAKEMLGSVGPDMLLELEPSHLARQGASVDKIRVALTTFGYQPYTVCTGEGGTVGILRCDWSAPRGSPNLFLTRDPERLRRAGIAMQI